MLISPEQIKAARAWMDWSRETLAHHSCLSIATIRNLEEGKISPRSLANVRAALESKGFAFYGKNGLSRSLDETRTYAGTGSCDMFYEDLLATIREKGGEIAAIFRTQDQLARALGVENQARLERLETLAKLAAVKCLLSDADHPAPFVPAFQFRTSAQNLPVPLASFIYGDKTAVVVANGTAFTFHVMRSIEMAQTSWKDFIPHWNAALPLVEASPRRC